MTAVARRIKVPQGMAGEFLRYCLAAGLGLAVDYGTLVFSVEVLGANYLVGAAAGFTLGLIVNFVLSEAFVFKGPGRSSRWGRFAAFGLIGLVGLGLLAAIMRLLTGVWSVDYVVSKTLGTGVVYLWNYLARRLLYQRSALGSRADGVPEGTSCDVSPS